MYHRELVLRTPLISFNERIQLKPECLQKFGSYKIRGLISAINEALPHRIVHGLEAASAGNLAQPLAHLAQLHKIPCRIHVPIEAPEVKKLAIRRLGAEVIELPFLDVWKLVQNPPEIAGLFVHPVFTPGLLQGYGTIAQEILADAPDADAVVVPFGVGGLTLGIARALRELNSTAHVYGCEPETAAPLSLSIAQTKACTIQRVASFVDAIGTSEVLPAVFNESQSLKVKSLTVTLEQIRAAMLDLLTSHKIVTEGAGAAALAGAINLAKYSDRRKVVAVLSGGNIAPQLFFKLCEQAANSIHGMSHRI